ncbi:MAG: 30S ribosomal protein S8e [Candidatus Aenigmarchaeota archaeon]|nr:30S ribosomal protein S8e [Candidatus Aenigmarchaeota archaeon]
MQWHLKLRGRTKTGKKYKRSYKKKRHQRGRDFLPTTIGTRRILVKKTRGGSRKSILLSTDAANIITKDGIKKSKILSVVGNPADSQFIRRNIITKGAIINTDIGKARVTSRPGQSGSVDAVLVEEKK